MIQVRKANPAFGIGDVHRPRRQQPVGARVRLREFGDDIVLCVNNLSRFAQAVELDLRPWMGASPIELMGGAHFPEIGELPYLLTLAGHGFYWLRIPRVPHPDTEPAAMNTEPQNEQSPSNDEEGGLMSTSDSVRELVAGWLPTQRWFAGKGRDFDVSVTRLAELLPSPQVTLWTAQVSLPRRRRPMTSRPIRSRSSPVPSRSPVSTTSCSGRSRSTASAPGGCTTRCTTRT